VIERPVKLAFLSRSMDAEEDATKFGILRVVNIFGNDFLN